MKLLITAIIVAIITYFASNAVITATQPSPHSYHVVIPSVIK